MAKKILRKGTLLMQDNALTESRYTFSKMEKNCLYRIIQEVRKRYVEIPNGYGERPPYTNMTITFPPTVLQEIADMTHKKQAHDALVSLQKKTVEMWWENGSWLVVGFINYAEWDELTQLYKVEVSDRILPYLVNLAEQYTSYSITVAMALQSQYSQRFYELCCQYRNKIDPSTGVPTFYKTQQQLREMMCLENKYTKGPDFNKHVIEQAYTELKKFYDEGQCDLWFDYIIKGRGKAQEYIFRIYTREMNNHQQAVVNDLRKLHCQIAGELAVAFPRDKKFVERTIHALDLEPSNLLSVAEKIQKIRSKYSGADFAKILRYSLSEDFDLE